MALNARKAESEGGGGEGGGEDELGIPARETKEERVPSSLSEKADLGRPQNDVARNGDAPDNVDVRSELSDETDLIVLFCLFVCLFC